MQNQLPLAENTSHAGTQGHSTKSWTKHCTIHCTCNFILLLIIHMKFNINDACMATHFLQKAWTAWLGRNLVNTHENSQLLQQKIRGMTSLAATINTQFQTHSCIYMSLLHVCDKDWKSVLTNISSRQKKPLKIVILKCD